MKKVKMPPEIQADYDEGKRLMAELKAEWDRRRDAEYEKYFNDPAIVALDEKAHALTDKGVEWMRAHEPKKSKRSMRLDMTKDQIADGPRPKGARPTVISFVWDCRDAAMLRHEAIYRGLTEAEIEKQIFAD
jgi:hypothetical protein